MYRSRALEFPGIGDCMAPCIDMANHAGGDATCAIYELDNNSDAVLLLRDNKSLRKGDEITISYGDAKGACEMLFSYGFIEDLPDVEDARTLFLDLQMMKADPLAKAKATIAQTAPGVKITSTDNTILLDSDYVWLICTNEEDGLEFMVQRTTTGDEELKAFFQGRELSSAADLKTCLSEEPLWDVFRLRVASILQDRVAAQLQTLYGSDEDVAAVPHGEGTNVRSRVQDAALRLRKLEAALLEKAYAHLDEEKETLLRSDTVVAYLDAAAEAGGDEAPAEDRIDVEEEDFS
ncbi:hypothetical protein ANO11243_039550 [Dothideomycetidae sp. 11243]|nr:hypothetical protein ANO11243_039550 [fungal sp. No.11243]